jgi:hypothetical protein
MVRAAGLYPAGSRFESWLPYQHGCVRGPGDADPSGRLQECPNQVDELEPAIDGQGA